jgi:ketosteroid isomerase-like protein
MRSSFVRFGVRAAAIGSAVLFLTATAHLADGATAAAPAAATVQPPLSPEVAAEHDRLRALRDELIRAVNEKNGDAIVAHMHPDVVLTMQDGKDVRAIRGRDAVRDYLNRMLVGPERGVESLQVNPVADDLSIFHHDDTAVSYGSSVDHYRLSDGTQFDLKTRWSATLVKDADRWLVAGLHVSSNLFDNPVLDGAKRIAMWIGVGAGVAGLVLGGLLMRLVRRRT